MSKYVDTRTEEQKEWDRKNFNLMMPPELSWQRDFQHIFFLTKYGYIAGIVATGLIMEYRARPDIPFGPTYYIVLGFLLLGTAVSWWAHVHFETLEEEPLRVWREWKKDHPRPVDPPRPPTRFQVSQADLDRIDVGRNSSARKPRGESAR